MSARTFLYAVAAFTLFESSILAWDSPVTRPKLINKVYPVADLIVPLSPTVQGQDKTLEQKLIQVIQATVEPRSWSCAGGEGHVDYFPLGMTLVVRQSSAVHEQIAELLAALRRLQDVEVTAELRFVTVSADMLEKLDLSGKEGTAPGVRLLDDTQVRLLLEAVQEDRRSNVLQAPKVTMFNGQKATLDLTEQQSFVVGVDFEEKEGKRIPKPKTKSVRTGLQFSLLPTVSLDKSEVTLQLAIQVSRANPQALVIQQNGEVQSETPRFSTVSLEKVLKLRDGSTALLTGWTQQREVRNEISTPILDKIPYLSRIFRTVSYGKEMEHTLVLVTPRIICCEQAKESAEESEPEVEEVRENGKDAVEEAWPQTQETNVVHVNSKSFELNYVLTNGKSARVQAIEVWVTRDGTTWELYPRTVKPTGSVPVTVKQEGRYGFILVPRSESGESGISPRAGDRPQTWVEVDCSKPMPHESRQNSRRPVIREVTVKPRADRDRN